MSQGYTSSKAGSPTGPEPGSYLLGYARKQIVKKHEKPVRDQYDEDLKALGEGRKDEGMDRESPKHMAAVKLQEGLKAVQPAIAAEVEKIEGVIISEFKKNTKDLERRSQPDRFTRAEVANAAVRSTALKASLGLPLDGDLTDAQRKVYYAADNPGLTPREQNEGNNSNDQRILESETKVTPG